MISSFFARCRKKTALLAAAFLFLVWNAEAQNPRGQRVSNAPIQQSPLQNSVQSTYRTQQNVDPDSDVLSYAGSEESSDFVEKRDPIRSRRKIFIGVSFGDPSPSWIGAELGIQLSWMVEVLASAGYFHWSDFTVGSASAQGRFLILPTKFTPFVGGGLTAYFVSGDGKFQGLQSTSYVLPYFNLGLDLATDTGLRVAAGVNFHFPTKLTFPFVNLGFSF